MVSSIHEAVGLGSAEWTPQRRSMDPLAFACGRVGPYRLGPELRAGAYGPVRLAVGRDFDEVLEIERVDLTGRAEDCASREGFAPRVLDRLNHCVGLRHPHVANLLGAGLDGESAYMLRAHTLGRTLSELAGHHISPPPDVAAGILYSVAEALSFLVEAGPQPGICGPGGVTTHSVFVGWDGSVRVHGAGFSLVRAEGEAAELRALRMLALALEPGLEKVIEDAGSLREAALYLRRWRREACAHRQGAVGAWMRRVDGEACSALRRFFSLDPLN